MAEINFSVIAIQASLKEKSVFIECTLDVDEDTVSGSSLIILNKTTNMVELYDATVDGHMIQAKLRNDPQPGDAYTILVQGTIESIVGDKLESALMREFQFESEVTSEVTLLSPANFEKIHAVKLAWEETGENLTGSFEWQIAKENAFYNIVYSTTVSDVSSIELPDIEPGQYYVRGRAIKNQDYGRWNETSTFLFEAPEKTDDAKDASDPDTPEPPPTSPTDDDSDPLIIVEQEEIHIEEKPTNGVTPKESFTFSFSEDIDITNLDIKVYRSDF